MRPRLRICKTDDDNNGQFVVKADAMRQVKSSKEFKCNGNRGGLHAGGDCKNEQNVEKDEREEQGDEEGLATAACKSDTEKAAQMGRCTGKAMTWNGQQQRQLVENIWCRELLTWP